MKWRRLLSGSLLLRRLARDLSGVRAELAQQNALLTRLADHFAPQVAEPSAAIRADTGVDFLDRWETARVQDYIAKVERDTGHTPTDDEVISYLADEKTVSLHQRLQEREAELASLGQRVGD